LSLLSSGRKDKDSRGETVRAGEFQVHLVALEGWRDVYVKFLAAESKESKPLRDDLERKMPAAQAALKAAECDVAAPSESGGFNRELSYVVDWVHGQEVRITGASKVSHASLGGKKPASYRASAALLETIEFAIETLRKG
jgi:hypothetical protein